jgi:hypothetical protein
MPSVYFFGTPVFITPTTARRFIKKVRLKWSTEPFLLVFAHCPLPTANCPLQTAHLIIAFHPAFFIVGAAAVLAYFDGVVAKVVGKGKPAYPRVVSLPDIEVIAKLVAA